MLEVLSFRNVGPAPVVEIELNPRLDFLAGDNGLGKSFLLAVAWLTSAAFDPGEARGLLSRPSMQRSRS